MKYVKSRATVFLDSVAVSMSLICAVHCLVTPLIIVLLPIVATSFWVNSNFHLWMMLLVIPTTTVAVFQGCKKHKDKAVIGLSASGLALLFSAALYETVTHMSSSVEEAHCNMCVTESAVPSFSVLAVINIVGGALLASAHIRNFVLCRKDDCSSCA